MSKFKLQEIERVAKQVSRRTQYPIRNSDQLAEALGGKNAEIEYEGRRRKVAEAEQIPDEIYPIESEDDFVNKMASLRGARGDEPEELPRGRQHDRRPQGEPPPQGQQ
jgi:hypothetical protein